MRGGCARSSRPTRRSATARAASTFPGSDAEPGLAPEEWPTELIERAINGVNRSCPDYAGVPDSRALGVPAARLNRFTAGHDGRAAHDAALRARLLNDQGRPRPPGGRAARPAFAALARAGLGVKWPRMVCAVCMGARPATRHWVAEVEAAATAAVKSLGATKTGASCDAFIASAMMYESTARNRRAVARPWCPAERRSHRP